MLRGPVASAEEVCGRRSAARRWFAGHAGTRGAEAVRGVRVRDGFNNVRPIILYGILTSM